MTTALKPLCKVCGKPVPKRMTHHSFGASAVRLADQHEFWRAHAETPKTKAEAQRLVGNQPIASLQRNYGGEGFSSASTWDGESYLWQGHFHAQGCAAEFGLAMAKLFPDHAMPAYREAVAAQKGKG